MITEDTVSSGYKEWSYTAKQDCWVALCVHLHGNTSNGVQIAINTTNIVKVQTTGSSSDYWVCENIPLKTGWTLSFEKDTDRNDTWYRIFAL